MTEKTWYDNLIGSLEPRLMYDGAAAATAAAIIPEADPATESSDSAMPDNTDVQDAAAVTDALLIGDDSKGAAAESGGSDEATDADASGASSSADVDSAIMESETDLDAESVSAAMEEADSSEMISAEDEVNAERDESDSDETSLTTSEGDNGETLFADTLQTITSSEVAFVDSRVEDYQQLVDGIDSAVDTVVIDSEIDGFAYMAATLENSSNIDTIHVFGHGAVGSATLGTTTITTENMDQYSAELNTIGSSMTENGDILLYGCSIGQETAFVDQFAALTAADVAASDDFTGGDNSGGDWVLETTVGSIESPTLNISNYDGMLAPAAFFGTDTAAGEAAFVSQVNAATESSAEFFEYHFTTTATAADLNGLEVTGSDGSTIYVKISRAGTIEAYNSPVTHTHDGFATYYLDDWSVSLSGNDWQEAVDEGVTFEFYSDAAMTTSTTINAFSTFTHHWGT